MSYDPEDQILMVANNAAAPPFATLISTWPQDRKVLGRITFTGASGIEQSVYDRHTHMFYQNVVQTGSDPNVGGVAVIDPRNIKVLTTFPINGCQPAGLALGPDQNLLVGCALTNNSQVISAIDGTVRALFPQVSGEDEVWFNRGDGNYYLAARNNPAANGGPSLGIINARTNTFIANVPTDASAHSVAADWRTNQVFVPLGPNNTAPNCANGCIGVYGDKNEMGLADRLQDYLASVR